MTSQSIASELDRLARAAESACEPAQPDLVMALLAISHQLPGLAFAAEDANPRLANELDRLARYLDERKTAGKWAYVDYRAVLKVTAETLHELAGQL